MLNRQDLVTRCIALLGEPFESVLAATTSGITGIDAITASDQIAGYLLDAARAYARSCRPIPATATATAAFGTAGWYIPASALTVASVNGTPVGSGGVPTGVIPWAIESMSVGGNRLTLMDAPIFDLRYNQASTPAGTPQYFTRRGRSGEAVQIAPPLSGAVVGTAITNGGSGYTSAPTATFSAPGGGGVTAIGTVTITNGSVTGVVVTAGGANYSGPTTITFSAPGGSGVTATGTVTLVLGVVISVQITNPGSGYSAPPTMAFFGGPGTGATATATVETIGVVQSITITNPGSLYTSAPTITFSGGGGTLAAATATIAGDALSATCYVVPAPLGPAGIINQTIAITAGGSGYTSIPQVTFSAPQVGNNAAQGTAVVVAGAVTAIIVTSPGSGYTTAPTISITGGGGTLATATCTLVSAADTVGFSYCFTDDEQLDILCPWAAWYVTLQASDDLQIGGREGELIAKVTEGLTRTWGQLVQTMPHVARWLYGGVLVLPLRGAMPVGGVDAPTSGGGNGG